MNAIAVHFSSASSAWLTPPAIIDRVLQALDGIDLDPCSNSHEAPNVLAASLCTVEDDGLSQPWYGRVYMNPPYGRDISAWVVKLRLEYDAGRVTEAIVLLPARTDTAWFRRLRPYPRCFIAGRLKFSGYQNSAPFPSAVVYLGTRPQRFFEAFAELGDVYPAAWETIL